MKKSFILLRSFLSTVKNKVKQIDELLDEYEKDKAECRRYVKRRFRNIVRRNHRGVIVMAFDSLNRKTAECI